MAKRRKLGTFETMAQCDKTGLLMPSSQMVKQWNGLFVSKEAYTSRPPQETYVVPEMNIVVPNARPFKMRSQE